MKKFVFITNSNKPTSDELNSKSKIILTSVSRPCIKTAINLGYEIYLGVNRKNPSTLKCEFNVNLFEAHIYRNLLGLKDNYIAYKNLMNVLDNNDIEILHCNSPIGGVLGRICGKRANVHKIIYTAHGFHFYKGAPLINNTFYKWVEQFLARWTDVIITLNDEDYKNAQKFKLKKNGCVYYIPGVGIDLNDFENIKLNKTQYRDKLGFNNKDILLISAGNINKSKNFETCIKALKLVNRRNIHLLICGEGPNLDNLRKLVEKLKIKDKVHFLGYRKDIKELFMISDIFIFASKREGLPRVTMEAMASGLPCIVSKIRGNTDLIQNGVNGYLFNPSDIEDLKNKIMEIVNDNNLYKQMKVANLKKIKQYDVNLIEKKIELIYSKI